MKTPEHIAIIMDGNGRWANARGLPRWEGHKEGATRVRPIVEACKKRGVKALTIFAFSEQNWGRPEEEISLLMELLARFIDKEKQSLMDQDIRVVTIGDIERLPVDASASIRSLVDDTRENSSFTLCIALSYGGREELVRAAQAIAHQVKNGELEPEDIAADTLAAHLDTRVVPWELDLIIRTSGEHRLSNFLLWQCAYAEFFFSDVPWPDFSVADLETALNAYGRRERRFGLVVSNEATQKGAT